MILSNSDILTEISVSETTPAHNLLNINLKMMPCLTAQSQLAVVNMINYVVDEIKYKIPDILCKHKNLALSSPAMKSLMTCQGWCVLVADRKKLLPGEVDLYCGRQRGGENVTETK